MTENVEFYEKYIVTRKDGQSEPGQPHHGCLYFSLDLTHDKFAAPALKAYADACEKEAPVLATALRAMLPDLPK